MSHIYMQDMQHAIFSHSNRFLNTIQIFEREKVHVREDICIFHLMQPALMKMPYVLREHQLCDSQIKLPKVHHNRLWFLIFLFHLVLALLCSLVFDYINSLLISAIINGIAFIVLTNLEKCLPALFCYPI